MDENKELQETTQETTKEENPILEYGSSIIQTSKGTVHVLTIVGQVEGHQVLPPSSKSTKYEHVMPLLAMVEESEAIDGLLVLLNTVGGDVEAGLGIAELIAGMSKPTVSLVLGGGHSIGVPLAVSAKRSFIAPSAAMTIHPVRLNGLVIGVPQTFYYFERVQERITQFVTANSKIKRETFTELMLKTGELAADVGSVIYGQEAVGAGADRRDWRLVFRFGLSPRDDPGAAGCGTAAIENNFGALAAAGRRSAEAFLRFIKILRKFPETVAKAMEIGYNQTERSRVRQGRGTPLSGINRKGR